MVLTHWGFSKLFHAMPCGKLLVSVVADIKMAVMSKKKWVTHCAASDISGRGDRVSKGFVFHYLPCPER